MIMKLYNTFTLKKEEFRPINEMSVAIYTCGPTVYDYAHIGNLRSYIFADILKRVLKYNGFEIKHVMNITDVGHLVSDEDTGEDKMTKALTRENKPLTLEAMKKLADFYTERFREDIADLNIEMPDIMPKASEHIEEDIEIIKKLEEKEFAYKISDGIYFDISKFSEYGKLGGLNKKEAEEKFSRVARNSEKRNSADFALWKFSIGENKIGWESPWGKGFPGWHIECSAMAVKYLGQPFDIHTGGIDHIPVHHQNEIAQSEAAYDKPLANYWMHGEFLVMDRKKMAKSAGAFITLKDIKEKGINPLAYRFLVLSAHYRSPLNFSWEALENADNGLRHLQNQVRNLGEIEGEINREYKENFLEKINDDLNMPQAMAVIFDLLKSDFPNENKLATILDFDRVLGLNLRQSQITSEISAEIQELADERARLREEKKWSEADEVREKIRSLGYEIEDSNGGYIIRKM